MTDIEAALEHQFQLVLETSDSRLFLHRLVVLWNVLTTEPLLVGVVGDARKGAQQYQEDFDTAQRQIAGEALQLLSKQRRQLQRLWPKEEGRSLGDLAEHLSKPEKHGVLGKTSSVGSAIATFRNVVASGIESLKTPRQGLFELRNALEVLQERSKHAERAIASQRAATGGFAALRLADLVAAANPAPAWEASMRYSLGKIAEVRGVTCELHGDGPTGSLEREINAARKDVATLREDLRLRLVLGRTRLALVRRFAGRCERYEAQELRSLFRTKAKSNNVERQLTIRFARYLYDQGLNPLIDPTIAGLRPDVYEPIPGHPFYVEAKQYGSEATACDLRRKMQDAVSQVLDTWGGLAQHEPVPEAFLLVFRRGGPRLETPDLLRVERGRLYLVLADIAPAAQSGSRNKLRPVRMDVAMLLGERSKAGR